MRQAHAVKVFTAAVSVPDLDSRVREGQGGCRAGNEPEELGDDGAKEDAFGGENGEDGSGSKVWPGG